MSISINSSSLRNLILRTPYLTALNNISKKSRKFSSRLINTVEPDDIAGFIKTKIYTEVNTNLVVGDRVFIVNGNYDSNVLIKKDRYRAGNDGYKILKIDNCAITLDLEYTGIVPWIESSIDSHIKVWTCFSQVEASYQSQIRVDNLASEQFRFESGLNNIIYVDYDYSTIFGTVSAGFSILDQPSLGTYSWLPITGSFSTNNLSAYVGSNSSNLIIMGNDFEYNTVKFRTDKVYGFTNSNWKPNHLYSQSILSKLNFRDGEFDGAFTDGIYGSYDKRIVWKKRDNNSWSSGIGLNMTWESGTMNSVSDSIVQNSYYASLDNGVVKQSTDKSNNRGWGYNYLLDCDLNSGVLYNGNFEGGHYGSASSTYSAMNDYILGLTYSGEITAYSGRFLNTEIFGGNYNKTIINASDVREGKFTNSTMLNSHLSKVVLYGSKFKADTSIAINTTDHFYYYDSFAAQYTVRYKFYINESDITKLKNLDTFYLKGLKFNKDAQLDKFENVFYLNNYGEKILTNSGSNMLGAVKCEVKTANENITLRKTTYQLFSIFGLGLIVPTTTLESGLQKPSLDITMQFYTPAFFGAYSIISNNYDWINQFNRLDIIENPYIIDAQYESGIMDNSTWEYGNIINDINYQIKQDGITNRLIINATTPTTLNINLKTSPYYTNWLDTNISAGDVIFLDNVTWQADVSPTASIPETLEQYSLNGAYKVAARAFGSSRVLYLESYDQEAITNLNTAYNTMTMLSASYSINGFYYTSNATLLPTAAGKSIAVDGWLNHSMPNFISISKTKIINSTVQSGVFVRTFFRDTTVYNKDFDNFDISLSRSNTDKLKLVNFILTSTTTNCKTSNLDATTNTYFTQNRVGNNINIKSGFVYNSVINYPKWTGGILNDSYWVNGTFNNGVAKSIRWLDGTFNNGRFIDSNTYNNTASPITIISNSNNHTFEKGSKMSFVDFWSDNPNNSDLYVDWMQNPYGNEWSIGDFNNGEMSNSVWVDGNKLNGKIFDTTWFYGNHYNGQFGDNTYKRESNQLFTGHWVDGIANNVTFGSDFGQLIWDKGEFNGGVFNGGTTSVAPLNWIDTNLTVGIGLVVADPTNVYNGLYGTGANVLINKFSDSLNPQLNTNTKIIGVSISGTYAVILTDLAISVDNSTLESGTLVKNYSLWKDGTFNNGYFSGPGSVWIDGIFNNGVFESSLYLYDHSQKIKVGDVGYAPYSEQRNNYNTNWHNGTFNNGTFKSSWSNGIWNDGRFEGKVWKDGTFKKGHFVGGSTYSAISNAEGFNMSYRNPADNFKGLWLNGNVIDDVRKIFSNNKIYSELVRRKDDLPKISKVTFENAKFMNGLVDHLNVEFTNNIWMNGVWKNGVWISGSFNPFVTRDIGINYITTGATVTDYSIPYAGSDGISGLTYSLFQFDDTCIWKNGTWNTGEFYYSNWENGLWKNGTMSGGIWNNGTWWYGDARNIVWVNGTWRNGNWYGTDYTIRNIVDGATPSNAPDGGTANAGVWDSFAGQVFYSNKNLYNSILLSRVDNKLLQLGVITSTTASAGTMSCEFISDSWHEGSVFTKNQQNYSDRYNNVLTNVARLPVGISNETNYYLLNATYSTGAISDNILVNPSVVSASFSWTSYGPDGCGTTLQLTTIGSAPYFVLRYSTNDTSCTYGEYSVGTLTKPLIPGNVYEVVINISDFVGANISVTDMSVVVSVGGNFGTPRDVTGVIGVFSELITCGSANTEFRIHYFMDDGGLGGNYHIDVAGVTLINKTLHSDYNSATYSSFDFNPGIGSTIVYSKVGNGRFLGGVWENGVWNNGWRVDTKSTTFAPAKYVEFDNISQFVKLSKHDWQFTITGASYSGLVVGDKVAIGNIVTYDINEKRKTIKSYYNVTALTATSLTVQTTVNFPIYRIVKDSDLHKISVTKNIWLSGAFLNGKFSGVWNSGLFTGFPFITVIKEAQWIDGRFEGGRFIATQSGTSSMSTGLIQRMDFKDQDISLNTNGGHTYSSWMDINYDIKYVTNLATENIVFDDPNNPTYNFGFPGNKVTKANYQGRVTHDILESISNLRDNTQVSFKNYNLGIKYTKFTDFIDDVNKVGGVNNSKFNKPDIYSYGWTVSDTTLPGIVPTTIGTMSTNIYQNNITSGYFTNEGSLFINKGDNSTTPYGVAPSYFNDTRDYHKISKLTHINIDIEINRYSMVEFDCYSWTGTPAPIADYTNGQTNDMYGNRIYTAYIFFFTITFGYYGNLYFIPETQVAGQGNLQHNPVRNNTDPSSKKMEFFYNRVNMDMYIGGSFSAVLDNLKFYEVDMIPFFKYYTGTSSINYRPQIPYSARAPFIDYTNQNYSFVDNVVISLDSISDNLIFEELPFDPGDFGGF